MVLLEVSIGSEPWLCEYELNTERVVICSGSSGMLVVQTSRMRSPLNETYGLE